MTPEDEILQDETHLSKLNLLKSLLKCANEKGCENLKFSVIDRVPLIIFERLNKVTY